MSCNNKENNASPSSSSEEECAICLQTCLYCIQLPCSHCFCFLCAKGTKLRGGRCALCRSPIPDDFLKDPSNYVKSLTYSQQRDNLPRYGWFYAGRNGWWEYDERTTDELEKAHDLRLTHLTVLIAGAVYTIDLERMEQYQSGGRSRVRKVKRDLATAAKKGVAGIPHPQQPDDDDDDVTCPPSTSRDVTNGCGDGAS